jgi:hypothetical protein
LLAFVRVQGIFPEVKQAIFAGRILRPDFSRPAYSILSPFTTEQTYWARDIVLLISDAGYVGAEAWLEAYHSVNFGQGMLPHTFIELVRASTWILQGFAVLRAPY